MRINGFEELAEIGRGGYGVVYSAWQPEFRRRVAVKVLSLALDGEAKRRLEREVAAVGSLSGHPHIVTVHATGTTEDGSPYLVMPLMEGGRLAEMMRAGSLDARRVTDIGVKLAGALASAHQGGVLHRDLKPDNVLLDAFGQPVLTDFGIATIAGAAANASGQVTASLAYAAPEVLSGRRPTTAADMYGLAATLLALLRGSAPFAEPADDGVAPMLARALAAPPPDLRPLGVPDAVCSAIERGLAKEPDDRWPSMSAFGEALRDAQSQRGWPLSELLVLGSERRDAASHGAAAAPVESAAATRLVGAAVAQTPGITPNAARRHERSPATEGSSNTDRQGRVGVLIAFLSAALVIAVGTVALLLRGAGEPVAAVVAPATESIPPVAVILDPLTASTPVTSPTQGLRVPDVVVGVDYVDAVAILREAGLELVDRIEGAAVASIPAGQVLEQEPSSGAAGTPDGLVTLIVAGEAEPAVPLMPIGATATGARTALTLCDGSFVDYVADNLIDGDVQVGWGVAGDGAGHSVTVLFGAPVQLTRIGLTPGYIKVGPRGDTGCTAVSAFDRNRFVTSVSYAFDDGTAAVHQFERQPQLVGFRTLW